MWWDYTVCLTSAKLLFPTTTDLFNCTCIRFSWIRYLNFAACFHVFGGMYLSVSISVSLSSVCRWKARRSALMCEHKVSEAQPTVTTSVTTFSSTCRRSATVSLNSLSSCVFIFCRFHKPPSFLRMHTRAAHLGAVCGSCKLLFFKYYFEAVPTASMRMREKGFIYYL